MAADNKLLLLNSNNVNVLSDAELILTDWDTNGIATNEVAYSNRLNALLRQITTVTHSVAELVATRLDKTIGSYDSTGVERITKELIQSTIQNVVLDLAENKTATQTINTVWAGPASGVAGTPAFRVLVANDIPNLDAGKITAGSFAAERIATDAIETAKIKDANVTAAKLASNAVETAKIKDANVTFAKIQNSASAGLSVLGRNTNSAGTFAEIAASTDGHILRRNGTTLEFGLVTVSNLADNAVETAKIKNNNVSLNKLSTDIVNDGKILDSLIGAKHSSVIGYQGDTSTLANYVVRILTQAAYDGITVKDANTIYIIRD